jgi:hypothetical protein
MSSASFGRVSPSVVFCGGSLFALSLQNKTREKSRECSHGAHLNSIAPDGLMLCDIIVKAEV